MNKRPELPPSFGCCAGIVLFVVAGSVLSWAGEHLGLDERAMALLEWLTDDPSSAPQLMVWIAIVLTFFGTLWWAVAAQKRWETEVVQQHAAAEERRRQALGAMTLEQIDALGGIGFEKWLAERLALAGFAVKTTSASGDFGVDLIVRVGSARLGVQAKCWQAPVGNEAVQAVIAGCDFYGCDVGVVVTNSRFTKAAIEQARRSQRKVILIDREQLAEVPALLIAAVADEEAGAVRSDRES